MSFSHVDEKGNPQMVDVGLKQVSRRLAKAQSIVFLPDDVFHHFASNNWTNKKGPIFHTAILAGVMAAKQTHLLIPLCHPLPLSKCDVEIKLMDKNVVIEALVGTEGKTGVEMEALTAASVAALTIYDMCKALSHNIIIRETKLMMKSGGKRDFERGSTD